MKKRNRIIFICIAVIIIFAIIFALNNYKQSGGAPLTVWFLDVGQADSVFIELPDGKNMLIDGGNEADGPLICDWLANKNIFQIDYLVATHPHEDHIGGLDDIFYEFSVLNYCYPYLDKSDVPTTRCYKNLVSAAKKEGCKMTELSAGDTVIDEDDLNISCLSPFERNYSNPNEYSVVLLLSYCQNKMLFMGDAQKLNEREMLDSNLVCDCDLIKIGHHGSNTSSSVKFLNTALPEYGVFSAAAKNQYNLPAKQIEKRYLSGGTQLYYTKDGSIKVTCNGKSIDAEITEFCLDGDR